MSLLEEDVELRDLLAQTLEKNGCLAKLRAELRASIFLALDEDIKLNTQEPLQNIRVQSYLQTPEGRIMFCLVREFLEFFNLQFTISVYEPESFLDSIGQYEGRQKVAKDLGLDNTEEPTVPLLQQLLKIAQSKSNVLDINLNLNENVNGSFKGNYNKTESCSISTNSNANLDLNLEDGKQPGNLDNVNNCNTTFDVNSPTVYVTGNRRINGEGVQDATAIEILQEPDHFEHSQSLADESADHSKCIIINVPALDESNKSNMSGEQSGQFNLTYDLDTPTVNGSLINPNKNVSIPIPKYLKDIREDDTYEDTSSITEDSEALDKHTNIHLSEDLQNNVPFKNPSSSNSESVVLAPKVSNSTKSDLENTKIYPQRPKASLSSLSDLPPLPTKTRVSSNILPSLGSKDFKNKSSLKELDQMFDIDADYEEDFMYSNESGEVNSNKLTTITIEEPLIANKTNLDALNHINRNNTKNSDTVIPDLGGKSVLKPIQTNCSNLLKISDRSNDSSIISEHTSESINSAQ